MVNDHAHDMEAVGDDPGVRKPLSDQGTITAAVVSTTQDTRQVDITFWSFLDAVHTFW